MTTGGRSAVSGERKQRVEPKYFHLSFSKLIYFTERPTKIGLLSFSFHVHSVNMEGEGLLSYPATSHQQATQMFQCPFWGAPVSAIFILR